jgi:hypothetical protein
MDTFAGLARHANSPLLPCRATALFGLAARENRNRKYSFVAEMKQFEADALAKLVGHFYENDGQRNAKLTCKHFKALGVCPRTVQNIIRRYNERGTTETMKRGQHDAKLMTPAMLRKVERLFQRRPNISERNAAAIIGVSKSTLRYMKVDILGYVSRKKRMAPKYVNDQAARAKKACLRLYRKLTASGGHKVVVMDDETYVPADPDQIPGSEYYCTRDGEQVPDKVRLKPKEKFTKKYLVWQALDQDGNVSDPFICEGTIDAQTYATECIMKRLIPFIEKHHRKEDVIFWPDMSRVYYGGVVQDMLRGHNIQFVAWSENSPNTPQARPIERFWALCKAAYKAKGVRAKNLNSFKRLWKPIALKVARQSGASLMAKTKSALRKIGNGGVFAPI